MLLNESAVEDAALEWFAALSYTVAQGPHLSPGEIETERDSFSDAVLVGCLRPAILQLKPTTLKKARATFRNFRIVENAANMKIEP